MDDKQKEINGEDMCPKCNTRLGEITTTKTGRKLQRCSNGSWDSAAKETVGCDYVKWFPVEPQELDEKCPKCQAKLILATTRFGKKMKKCSNSSWDKVERKAVGCDYVEWINGTTEPLDEECPQCGSRLVLFTTNAGKKMKKCSTAGWDKQAKKPTGCTYIQWLKASIQPEFLPPEPPKE